MFLTLQQIMENKNIWIAETKDPKVAVEYLRYCEKERDNEHDPDEVLEKAQKLFTNELTLDQKKELIALIAAVEDIEANNILKKYNENPDPQLEDWASIALQENETRLKSIILGEPQILIAGKLGGKNGKLRNFAAVFTKKFEPLEDWQKQLIYKELNFAFKNINVDIEKIEYGPFFANIILLEPINANIYRAFHQAIDKINELGNFLYPEPLYSTDKILSLDETQKLLEDNVLERNSVDGYKLDWDKIDDFLDDEDFEDIISDLLNDDPDNPPENDDK